MPLINLTDADFGNEIEKYEIAILDFWAPWCGPCKQFGPIFEQVSKEYPDILFGKINTEEEHGLASHFQIQSIPTITVMRDNIILYQNPGMIPEEGLKDLLEQVQKLDMDQIRKEVEEQQKQQN